MDLKLAVYILRTEALVRTTIAVGSGIVGPVSPDSAGRTLIDYEGNVYGSTNLIRFADRVANAASRHIERYPTVARAYVRASDLQRVGSWDAIEGNIELDSTNEAELAAWLGVSVIDPVELLATGARYEQRRDIRAALASGDPTQVAAARFYAHHHHIDID